MVGKINSAAIHSALQPHSTFVNSANGVLCLCVCVRSTVWRVEESTRAPTTMPILHTASMDPVTHTEHGRRAETPLPYKRE